MVRKICVFWERNLLRKIFGPICVAGYWRSRTNEEVRRLYGELGIVTEKPVLPYGSEAWCLTANGEKNLRILGKEFAEKNIWSDMFSRILEEQNK
jgi:hypothetical protein